MTPLNEFTPVSQNTNMQYSGDVKFTTYIGGKPVSCKQYHNAGALSLFRFLANCLAGNFSVASPLRPYKLKLLTFKTDTPPANPKELIQSLKAYTNDIVGSSSFIDINSSPEIYYTVTENTTGCQVVFNFVFPYHKLTQDAYIVAIYGIHSEGIEDMCAYYLLTSEVLKVNQSTGKTEKALDWDPIIKTPDDEETNKILAVEWTMSLFNTKTAIKEETDNGIN
jgi:hypothetical protein